MLVVIVFVSLLVVVFGLVMFVLRPTKKQQQLEDRLASIAKVQTDAVVEEEPDLVKRENLSDVPLIEFLLRELRIAKRLQTVLLQADLTWTVGRVFAGTAFLLVAVPVVLGFFLHNLLIQIISGILAAAALYLYIFIKRSARFSRFNDLLPEAIDLLTRALKAGHAINAAIEMVSREIPNPVGAEFRRTFEEQNFGLPMREAMINLAARVPIPDVQFLVTAILVQKETGGNLVEILEKTATVLRERLRLKGQLKIYTAQGRLTGWILAGLPFIVFIGMNIINPQYGRVMLEDPLGQKLIYLGLILMALGGLVIRKIIDIKV